MRDDRSLKMKRILKEKYPSDQFRVRIEKYSMGESIYVGTTYIPDWTGEDRDRLHGSDETLKKDAMDKAKTINERTAEIETLLKDFWHVDRDSYGDILGGGNTYIHVASF